MPFDKEQKLAEEENFKHFDVNKDAVLDKDEIASWAMPSHNEAAEEEAEHLLEVRNKQMSLFMGTHCLSRNDIKHNLINETQNM